MSVDVDCDSAPPAVHRETTVKARKEHRCAACHETIRVGDRYAYQFTIWDWNNYETRRCLRCQSIHMHLREKCRDERDAEQWPDDALNCGHGYEENWGHEPPPEIAALAFALPDEMQKEAKT